MSQGFNKPTGLPDFAAGEGRGGSLISESSGVRQTQLLQHWMPAPVPRSDGRAGTAAGAPANSQFGIWVSEGWMLHVPQAIQYSLSPDTADGW